MEKEKLVKKIICDVVCLSTIEQLGIAAQFVNTMAQVVEFSRADIADLNAVFTQTYDGISNRVINHSVNVRTYIDLAFPPPTVETLSKTPVLESSAELAEPIADVLKSIAPVGSTYGKTPNHAR